MNTRKPYHPEVRPTSHPLQFEVQSESGKGFHNVSLDVGRFNGFCTCPHYLMRLDKLIAKEGHAASDRTRCKHIRAARTFFCNVMIRGMAREIAAHNKQ